MGLGRHQPSGDTCGGARAGVGVATGVRGAGAPQRPSAVGGGGVGSRTGVPSSAPLISMVCTARKKESPSLRSSSDCSLLDTFQWAPRPPLAQRRPLAARARPLLGRARVVVRQADRHRPPSDWTDGHSTVECSATPPPRCRPLLPELRRGCAADCPDACWVLWCIISLFFFVGGRRSPPPARPDSLRPVVGRSPRQGCVLLSLPSPLPFTLPHSPPSLALFPPSPLLPFRPSPQFSFA